MKNEVLPFVQVYCTNNAEFFTYRADIPYISYLFIRTYAVDS